MFAGTEMSLYFADPVPVVLTRWGKKEVADAVGGLSGVYNILQVPEGQQQGGGSSAGSTATAAPLQDLTAGTGGQRDPKEKPDKVGWKQKKAGKLVGWPAQTPKGFYPPWRDVGVHSPKPQKERFPLTSTWTQSYMALQMGCHSDFDLLYLEAHLSQNGNMTARPVLGDGACFFSSVRRQIPCPAQYSNQMLRREVVMYMAMHADFVFPRIQGKLQDMYGYMGEDNPGPFSYKGYLEYMLDDEAWGDLITAEILSLMWGCRVTVLLLPTLTEVRLRHQEDLKNSHLVLILQGNHYNSIGKSWHQN